MYRDNRAHYSIAMIPKQMRVVILALIKSDSQTKSLNTDYESRLSRRLDFSEIGLFRMHAGPDASCHSGRP